MSVRSVSDHVQVMPLFLVIGLTRSAASKHESLCGCKRRFELVRDDGDETDFIRSSSTKSVMSCRGSWLPTLPSTSGEGPEHLEDDVGSIFTSSSLFALSPFSTLQARPRGRPPRLDPQREACSPGRYSHNPSPSAPGDVRRGGRTSRLPGL